MDVMWDVLPFLRLGPIQIRYYSLLFMGVFLGGWLLYRWQVVRGGGKEGDANWMLIIGIFSTWIGGRLGHLLFYAQEEFVSDPWVFFDASQGGLASHGAWMGMSMTLLFYAHWRQQSFVEMCDRMAFTSAFGAALIRIGNLFNSEVVGRATGQDWGFRFPRFEQQMGVLQSASQLHEAPLRHPVQLYEAGLAIAVLILLLVLDSRWKEKRLRGVMASVFVSSYFTGRFFVEFFKEFEGTSPDSVLTVGQWLSIPSAVLGLTALIVAFRLRIPAQWRVGRGSPSFLS